MKVLVAGSREIADPAVIERAIRESGYQITTLICGMARGVDMLAYHWAKANNVPVEEYPANWDKYGKSAGMRRNREMVAVAEAAVIVWDGNSPGTENTISLLKAKGIPYHLVEAF